MRGLDVIGPFKGTSGYDRHTREFVREFVRQGTPVRLIQLHGWSQELPASIRETWFDELSQPVDAETVLHFTMPNHGRPQPGRRNANYTMFEADRIPAAWAKIALEYDLTVVPTEASFRAWIDSGVPAHRLGICPLGVNAEQFRAPVAPAPLTLPDGRPVSTFRSRFLHIAELRPRKNHLGLLRAWMQATRREDDAILILKASVFQPNALAVFQADVDEMQRRLGRSLAQAASVLIVPGALTSEMVRGLYAAATHYISMSHGEGWDLPMMEAAVSGLQLIAPDHTAYPSYLRPEDAHFIPSASVPAIFEGRLGMEDQIFFQGLRWWNPDEDAAAALLRSIIAGTVARHISPGDRIAREYSWANAASRLLGLLRG